MSSLSVSKKSPYSHHAYRHSVDLNPIENDAEFGVSLKLDTLNSYTVTEIRPKPTSFMNITRSKYGEIEDLQHHMPELADCRFNLADIFPQFSSHYEINIRSYFVTDQEPSPEQYETLAKEIDQRLALYKALQSKRTDLRQVFLSYNLAKMTEAKDLLSMGYTNYLMFLHDCMLIGDGFSKFDAARVFAVSSTPSRTIPEVPSDSKEEWLISFEKLNINNRLRLNLSGFIEALVRVVFVHPRFKRGQIGSLANKFLICFERNLKPNALLNQMFFFEPLLSDLHIIDLADHFQLKTFEVFSSYVSRLGDRTQAQAMLEGNMKLELLTFYKMLDELEVLEVTKTDEDEDNAKAHYSMRSKVITLKFASSLINKSIRRATLTDRDMIEYDLVPIAMPLREEMRVDKFIAFCFFVAAMRRNYDIFFIDRDSLNDADFALNFLEFSDLIMLMAMYYWKTVDRTRSLVAAVYDFLNTTLVACLKARPATFILRTNGVASEKTISARAKQGRHVVTRTAQPQKTCLKRRNSV